MCSFILVNGIDIKCSLGAYHVKERYMSKKIESFELIEGLASRTPASSYIDSRHGHVQQVPKDCFGDP